MRRTPGILCLVVLALARSSRAKYILGDRRLFEEGDFYGMPQAPQEALQPAESPSVPLSSLHLTGSVPEDRADMHVRDWDPEIRSFLVRSKQPGLGCHQLGAKQPLQQRAPEGNPIASNYFFRGGSSTAGVGSDQGDAASGGRAEGSSQGGDADGSPPCADLPFNIFAALSRDGYVRHTALTGDQPEFR